MNKENYWDMIAASKVEGPIRNATHKKMAIGSAWEN